MNSTTNNSFTNSDELEIILDNADDDGLIDMDLDATSDNKQQLKLTGEFCPYCSCIWHIFHANRICLSYPCK